MTLSKLLETREAEQLAAVKTVAPTGWERGNERKGNVGQGSTGPIEPGTDVTEKFLLERAGFDPDEWEIVPPIEYREWDANLGGGEVRTLQYRKFKTRVRGTRADIDDLLFLTSGKLPKQAPLHDVSGDGVYVFANGDWQLGKSDGDGTEGIVNRIMESTQRAVEEYLWIRHTHRAPYVHIAWLGDCLEGFTSQGGKNAWRTELTLTEQIRLMRRLYLMQIDAFRDHAEGITCVAVPGNHDEAVREPGMTRYDDSYAIDGLVAVADAMELNPAAYGHVETFVPRKDSLTVTLDVHGTKIVHLHGHQTRKAKHWEWWQGQAFEPGSEIGQATVALSGHHHGLLVEQKGSRTWVINKTQESESTWWKNRTGDAGSPGAVTLITRNGKVEGFRLV